ncbi:Hypothetical predicted protein, partial [Pelobates cultripes]
MNAAQCAEVRNITSRSYADVHLLHGPLQRKEKKGFNDQGTLYQRIRSPDLCIAVLLGGSSPDPDYQQAAGTERRETKRLHQRKESVTSITFSQMPLDT